MVLYNKYRPRFFSEVRGQDHITSTLKNEIKTGRISHAYLFAGSRGTGKTSTARIFARAVNCPNSVDGEPCNQCEICRGLEDGSIYDIIEIDAASNTGVDNIRNLREEINYTPSRCKYRVYIIDEVHMLSTGAFNALLKTLEEPPEHVIFILATTEVHKLPETILSRCQRHDFHRIYGDDMAGRLFDVAAAEGLTLHEDAAALISRIADGAMRNALSVLDQCSAVSKDITEELVAETCGIANISGITDAVLANDTEGAINTIGSLYNRSYDMEQLCNGLIKRFRDIMVYKTVKKSRDLITCEDEEYEDIKRDAGGFSLNTVLYAIDLLYDALAAIKGGADARIEMETCVLKLCRPQLSTSATAMLERIDKLEKEVKRLKAGGAADDANIAPAAPAAPQADTYHAADKAANSAENNAKAEGAGAAAEKGAYEAADTAAADDGGADEATGSLGSDFSAFLDGHADSAHYGSAAGTAEDKNGYAPVWGNAETAADETGFGSSSVGSSGSSSGSSGGTKEFTRWAELMEEIQRADSMLSGFLYDSRAYIRGNQFLIETNNPGVRPLLNNPVHTDALQNALIDITGVQYDIGFYNESADKPTEPDDQLSFLTNKVMGKDNVEIQ